MLIISEIFGISKNLEVLLIILIGFGILIFDSSSLFQLNSNLKQIWSFSLDLKTYPIMHQIYLKYLLCAVVLVRTFTLHTFLALYVVMLWPTIFETRYNLLLPWLVVGVIRCLFTNLVSLLTGCYICFANDGFKVICGDFILSQIIDHGPSVYSWFAILSFYKDLRYRTQAFESNQNKIENEQIMRRKKARSMMMHMNFDEKADDGSESTIGNLLHHLRSSVITKSRSLDTLLTLQAAEEEREEIMNAIEEFQDDKNKNVIERAKTLLNIVSEDISKARKEKNGRTLRILSDITMDALSFVGTARYLSRASSASFFIKNGIAYRAKCCSNWDVIQSVKNSAFHDCIEEEKKNNISINKSECELINLFLDNTSKKHNKI